MVSVASNSDVGQRLLPSYLDEIALSDPRRILYSIAKTRDPADGFQDISAGVFARAVNRCAWYLEEKLGKGKDFPKLLYIGPQDLVYGILTLASIKTGYVLQANSPRNTLEAHLSLLEKTNCTTFLLPPNFPLPVVKQILEVRPMRVVEIAPAQHWFDELPGSSESDEPVYPYTKQYAEARLEPWLMLHTSGSTGMPKPIAQTHATYTPLDAYQQIPAHIGGQQRAYPASCRGRRVYLGLPLFHCAGANTLLPSAIFNDFTVVLGPFPPSAEVVDAMHKYGNIQESIQVPTVLVDLAKDPEAVDRLGKLELLTYAGGPMPRAVGDLLSSRTQVHSALGTTEAGIMPGLVLVEKDASDWSYIGLSPALGAEYRHVSEDLYEQVIVRKKKLEPFQGIFGTFPELTEWPMKDLYSRHPTRKEAWLYRGRSDDIIVFSTGEKLNPIGMESIIHAHPDVNAAIVSGMGRFQTGLLVEASKPPTSGDERDQLLEAIWPSVQAANKESPSHGRIHRDMIIFTSPEKPMLRAGKGTVQRQSTLSLYSAEFDALYSAVETPAAADVDDTYQSIRDAVITIIAGSADLQVADLADDTNLFERGLDSLQVTVISRKLNKYLTGLGKPPLLGPRTVYSNPSISALINAVEYAVEDRTVRPEDLESTEQKMQKLYDLYTRDLPISARDTILAPTNKRVILLTGSTGSLGSYVLDSLAANSKVARIYCLNRGPQSLQRQQRSQAAKGLSPLVPDKVVCLDADLSRPRFGLATDQYKQLLRETTHIIHNAWQVDFNLSVESFTVHLAIVRHLVDFSAHARFGPTIFFISSISAVANWPITSPSPGTGGKDRNQGELVPQEIFHDWHVPEPIGYGQSKLLAERILEAAAVQANIPAIVCRLGQVAGPTTAKGVWPRQEWLPSLIASSKYLGKVPVSLGRLETIDWIPVDVLGRIIVELAVDAEAETESEPRARVHHTVNPRHTEWGALVPAVAEALGVDTVPLETWVKALGESNTKAGEVTANPAIKILDFYESLVTGSEQAIHLDTKESVSASATLAALQPVDISLMENWLTQWDN
ncbi:unnamed protein product [Discula destructiva]